MEMTNRKIKKVRINTPEGVKYLTYKPVHVEDLGMVCDKCPYYGKCDKFLNPETPDDKESSFQEFCADLGTLNESDEELKKYCPKEGTLEDNLSDLPDVYEVLVKGGGYVKLADVIDVVCKDTCPYWNSKHTDCKSTNNFCILEDLIKKSNG